jgi:uncharacterized protein YcaQ
VPTLDQLRHFAVARSLFTPTTLKRAIERLGFVQADPIRAPARAQDLTLRHRVRGYRAGDLERRYASLGIEEDFTINYGFLPRSVQKLMHPRPLPSRWDGGSHKHAHAVLAFVRDRARVHPREVDAALSLGSVRNYWGGSSTATTHLLQELHYRGLLRVVGRDDGFRLYAAHTHDVRNEDPAVRDAEIDALIDAAIVRSYAPLHGTALSWMVLRLLRYGAPQWHGGRKAALARAKARLAHARIGTVDWYWPANERVTRGRPDDTVRLLAPFDPVVFDRRRFELFWGWAYRFEAYTPAKKRRMGYYALPILWRDRVIGWGNLAVRDRTLHADFGYVSGRPPRERVYARELDAELARVRAFLRLGTGASGLATEAGD